MARKLRKSRQVLSYFLGKHVPLRDDLQSDGFYPEEQALGFDEGVCVEDVGLENMVHGDKHTLLHQIVCPVFDKQKPTSQKSDLTNEVHYNWHQLERIQIWHLFQRIQHKHFKFIPYILVCQLLIHYQVRYAKVHDGLNIGVVLHEIVLADEDTF